MKLTVPLFQEIKSYYNFLTNRNKTKSIVFYSESSIYYQYYEGLIKSLLNSHDIDVHYITSDLNDDIFRLENENLKTYYINKLLPFFMLSLDAKVLIMTMPDLNKYHIKRSTKDVEHIYMFHALVSTHMMYRNGAFDHYDTIFCVGPHQVREIRAHEEINGLKSKKLINTGYYRLEKIYENYQAFIKTDFECRQTVLIAPSWHAGNILESCVYELITNLLALGYKVILRPHPEFIKRKMNVITQLSKEFMSNKKFEMELNMLKDTNFYKAGVLITDWSGIAFEYAFGTERPVILIDTPPKVHNPDYQKLDIVPMEVELRNIIGITISQEEIGAISNTMDEIISKRDIYRDRVIRHGDKYVFNWGKSVDIELSYLMDRLK